MALSSSSSPAVSGPALAATVTAPGTANHINNNSSSIGNLSNCSINNNNTSSCSTASSSTKDVSQHHHRHHNHSQQTASGSEPRPNGVRGENPAKALYHSHTMTQPSRTTGHKPVATNTKGSPFCTSATSCCSNQLMHLSLDESSGAAVGSEGSMRKTRALGMSQSLHMSSGHNHSSSSLATSKAVTGSGEEAVAAVPSTKPSYSPMQVLMLFGNKLSPYEYREILDYKRIYFIGNAAAAGTGNTATENPTNGNTGGNGEAVATVEKARKDKDEKSDATDSGGDKRKGAAGAVENFTPASHDHVAYRYEVLKLIGKGSFGVVYKAYDHKYGRYVALKMVRNERRFHRQAQEEIKILEYLRRIDHRNEFNVIHMYDHFLFRQQMFITFELLYINLFELIRKNKFCGFSIQVVRKFAHSLLICLNALHTQKIIHCDLKVRPSPG